jgi:hypothetical protein
LLSQRSINNHSNTHHNSDHKNTSQSPILHFTFSPQAPVALPRTYYAQDTDSRQQIGDNRQKTVDCIELDGQQRADSREQIDDRRQEKTDTLTLPLECLEAPSTPANPTLHLIYRSPDQPHINPERHKRPDDLKKREEQTADRREEIAESRQQVEQTAGRRDHRGESRQVLGEKMGWKMVNTVQNGRFDPPVIPPKAKAKVGAQLTTRAHTCTRMHTQTHAHANDQVHKRTRTQMQIQIFSLNVSFFPPPPRLRH